MEINDEIFRINITKMQDNILLGCGYCKHQLVKSKSRIKNVYKITAKSIPLYIYQSLVEKGWTICGNRLYKINYEKCCCKLYQPRVNINNFKISKEQRKIMKRFRKYLSGEYDENKINKINNKLNNINISNKNIFKENSKKEDEIQKKIDKKLKQYISSQNFNNILNKFIVNEDDIDLIYKKLVHSKIRKNNNKKLEYDYSCDLIFIIKNVLLQLKKKNEINDNNENINKNEIINIQNNQYQSNDYTNFINELYNDFFNFYRSDNYYENKITISFNETTCHINFKLKNEIKINKEPKMIEKNNQNNYINKIKNNINKINVNSQKEKYIFDYFKEIVPEPEIYLPLKHKYTIELTDKIQLEPSDERYLLYSKYQLIVHKETTTVEACNNFLALSPIAKKEIKLPLDLNKKTKHPELYPKYYGTYNLIHRIDDKIVAVTVIGILPNYLESHYCYYDPDFSFLDLGVFTAIREIEYMKSFQELIDKNLTYYTMGEMSQSVTKLKYKGDYFPTEIMDNYTGIYVLLSEEIKKLISDNECHHLVLDEKNKNVIEYFYNDEIDYVYNNIIIDIMGDKLLVEDFLNLYFEDNLKEQNLIRNKLKKFLKIIDIETFTKINFYYDNTE